VCGGVAIERLRSRREADRTGKGRENSGEKYTAASGLAPLQTEEEEGGIGGVSEWYTV
jgi:hypothetical protein